MWLCGISCGKIKRLRVTGKYADLMVESFLQRWSTVQPLHLSFPYTSYRGFVVHATLDTFTVCLQLKLRRGQDSTCRTSSRNSFPILALLIHVPLFSNLFVVEWDTLNIGVGNCSLGGGVSQDDVNSCKQFT